MLSTLIEKQKGTPNPRNFTKNTDCLLNPELISSLESCTDAEFSSVKRSVIELNNAYIQALRDDVLVTSFDRRKAKSAMDRLFQETEKVDIKLHSGEFRFHGEPIPKNEYNTEDSKRQTQTEGEKGDEANRIETVQKDQNDSRTVKITSDSEGQSEPRSFESIFIPSSSHGLVENVSRCFLQTSKSEPPPSIHIQNAANCAMLLACSGPVILHNVCDSVLVVRCHQLRLHNLQNCVVFAETESGRVVMEQSRGLQFGGLLGENLVVPTFEVDDFDWPAQKGNPHYEKLGSVSEPWGLADLAGVNTVPVARW